MNRIPYEEPLIFDHTPGLNDKFGRDADRDLRIRITDELGPDNQEAPVAGNRALPLRLSESAANAVSPQTSRTYQWQVSAQNRNWQETWICHVDSSGNCRLKDRETDSTVTYFSDKRHAAFMELSGPTNRLLKYFYLGTILVPSGSIPKASRPARLSALCFLPQFYRPSSDFLLSFIDFYGLCTENRLHLNSSCLRVSANFLDSRSQKRFKHLPDQIDIDFSPDDGPVQLIVSNHAETVLTAVRYDFSSSNTSTPKKRSLI